MNVYLDHQSATPLLPEVFEAMRPYLTDAYGSPSSLHQHGLRVRDAIQVAREQVAAFIQAGSPEEIVFTSDGSESVNLAIKGSAWANQRRGTHLVTSVVEHPAVLESIAFLEGQGFTSTKVGVDAEGRIDVLAWVAALSDQTVLACVHAAHHDLGTLQPLAKIVPACQERGVPVLVDAEAAAGALPLDVRTLSASLLSFSPHKFGGPKGVGILYRHRRARLRSLIHGGIQENGLRAGAENVPGIIGAGAACELAGRRRQERMDAAARLQQRLWEGLRERVPFLKLNGPSPGDGRLRTNLNVSVEFVEGEGLLLMLDTQGVAVASGTSCASKATQASPVLMAIGMDPALAQGSVLFSFGDGNTADEVDRVLDLFPKIVARLRGMSPLWDEFQRGLIDSVIAPRVTPSK